MISKMPDYLSKNMKKVFLFAPPFVAFMSFFNSGYFEI